MENGKGDKMRGIIDTKYNAFATVIALSRNQSIKI